MSAPAAPVFEVVTAALHGAGSLGDTAEIHGSLCGLLCLLGQAYGTPWLDELLDGSEALDSGQDSALAVLDALGRWTHRALEEGDMSFRPLLPDDDIALAERAQALAHWCQGFAHGLAVGSELSNAQAAVNAGVTAEIVGDFTELAGMGFADDETEAEGEAAYTELVEYVRVSVQLVFEELHPMRERLAQPARH